MNPNSPAPDSNVEFKEDALNAKFSYSFTRKQLIVLFNTLSPIQLPVGDIRTKVLAEILDEIRRTAIQSITSSDYVQPEAAQPLPEAPVAPEAQEIVTN